MNSMSEYRDSEAVPLVGFLRSVAIREVYHNPLHWGDSYPDPYILSRGRGSPGPAGGATVKAGLWRLPMLGVHRFRALVGVAAAAGVVAFAVHAGAQAPTPGRYVSWAPPAVATATP